MCITETHLDNSKLELCNIEGYKFIPNCRSHKHVNSPHTFGGVGIFVKEPLYQYYDVIIEDRSYDGILQIQLKQKIDNLSVIIVCCYLPPEKSPWCCSDDFFAHLLGRLYMCSDNDIILFCGDINARIGTLKDFTVNVDNIEERHTLDECKNNHGKAFIDFMIDAKVCVLNGRGDDKYDNFTYVSPLGKSVVDYFFVPHDVLKFCSNFKVLTINDIIDKNNLQMLLSDKCKKPDHSVISVDIDLTMGNISMVTNKVSVVQSTEKLKGKQNVKFNLKRMPIDMFSSELCKRALLNVIDCIECNRETQTEIDNCYNNLKDVIVQEMKDKIPLFNNNRDKKKYKISKPYWNEELGALWKEMHLKEKEFLCYKGSNIVKCDLRVKFKLAAQKFDRTLRKYKRQYERGKVLELESVCTSNPREFWSHIKKLGPRKNCEIPMEVYDKDGCIEDNLENVLYKWKEDFKSLYNVQNENEHYDDNVYQGNEQYGDSFKKQCANHKQM